MEAWYLIYCKRGQLERARINLDQQQVICFSPLHNIEKYLRGKRIISTEPLFPNYLFIKFDPEQIHTTTINATRGVSHFVRFGAYPTEVAVSVIDALMNQPIHNSIDHTLPCEGDNVHIMEGVFAGLNAIYAEPDGEKRSILLLNLVNKQVRYSINNNEFKKLI